MMLMMLMMLMNIQIFTVVERGIFTAVLQRKKKKNTARSRREDSGFSVHTVQVVKWMSSIGTTLVEAVRSWKRKGW